ncbi:MAG: phosphatidylserine decarboxylase, partial [Gammaproteobacteria bacterium]
AVRHYPDTGDAAIELQQGDEMGRFNMGSTVILLYGEERVAWQSGLQAGTAVQLGDRLGRIRS